MAPLADRMPPINLEEAVLREWGQKWKSTGEGKSKENCFTKKQGMDFGYIFDGAVGVSLAAMLGGIDISKPNAKSLLPPGADCVEVGPVKIIGGVRAQSFDAAYRPDGVRIAFDSKTLNDFGSVRKNWQNMVNDLATEATTVHIRFPYAIVAFMVVIPEPAIADKQRADIVRTLERLCMRNHVLDEAHLAEALALILWNPETGRINTEVPEPSSNLRIERFSENIYKKYVERYKGLPPHAFEYEEPSPESEQV